MENELSKPRVLRIIARMNVGGPAIQVTNLMLKLPSESFEQLLLTGFCAEDENDYLFTRKVKINVKRIRHLGRAINPLSDILALREIYLLIRDYKPNIIHTHTFKAGLLGRIGALLSRRKVKLVHTFHGHLLFGYFGYAGTKSVIGIEKFLAKRTDRLIAVGYKVRDELIEAGIGNLRQYKVISPGFDMILKRDMSKLDLGLSSNSFVCGWFGRITQIKRLDRILDIAFECKSRGIKDITFLIVGDGELRKTYEKRAVEKQLPLIFLGWRHDISSLMQICDIVLCTSENEGTPISLIEAQLLGKPVISTDVGSVGEVTISERAGYVLNYGVMEFSTKIIELAQDSNRYQEFSETARIFASKNFTLDSFIRNHLDLYEEILTI